MEMGKVESPVSGGGGRRSGGARTLWIVQYKSGWRRNAKWVGGEAGRGK